MKVGFIGLGSVGGKLAGSLLRNGLELSVYDLNADTVAEFAARGAAAGEGPAAMMTACDDHFFSLDDDWRVRLRRHSTHLFSTRGRA